MNFAFRILLTFNATSLLIIIYFVQKGLSPEILFPHYPALMEIPEIAAYGIYLLIPIASTSISIFLSQYLGKDSFEKNTTERIEHANNSFLPSYLGYFFVALSINSTDTLLFVYLVLFIFTLLSQALYFNPLFLLFGYEFYNITTKNGTVIFLISKQKYRSPADVDISSARRINNYTFIEHN